MSENSEEIRLPPPAFPPGMRRRSSGGRKGGEAEQATQEAAEDVFISPDAPMPERQDRLSGAFISPDEPIPERKIELVEAFQSATDGIDPDEEGVVVGMDLGADLEPAEVVSGGDPHVMEVMDAVSTLSDALRRKGEGGLRTHPDMSRFEATLRSYCVGYLAGRRAEEPAPPVVQEPLPTDG
jgi:hypothetical protein